MKNYFTDENKKAACNTRFASGRLKRKFNSQNPFKLGYFLQVIHILPADAFLTSSSLASPHIFYYFYNTGCGEVFSHSTVSGNYKDSEMTKLSLIHLAILLLTSCGMTKVSLESAKSGNCLNKAHLATPQEYFNDFYNTRMNSAWDNSWYKLYETNDIIFYGQKSQWNKNRLQYFKKVEKDSLKACLPGYISFNPDKFSKLIHDSILAKIDNTRNSCSQSTDRLEHEYKLKDGNILVKFTYTKTCDRTSTTVTQYSMTLSGNDLSVLSSKTE